jgi:putative nucleotidyltransferase with HDIG domain
MKSLPRKLQIYLTALYVATPLLIYTLVYTGNIELKLAGIEDIIFFSIFAVLTESSTVVYKNLSFSTTVAVTVAAYILFGPLTAIIITLIGFSLRFVKIEGQTGHILNVPLYKTFFNYCVDILTISGASYVYFFVGGKIPVIEVLDNIIPIIAFTLTFYLINTLLISILVSILSNRKIVFCFIGQLKITALNSIIMVPFGMLIVFIFHLYGYFGVSLFIFPILLARYTFSLYIEAKNKYVQTVDALMRAVEARDKYTEGHSQRVAKLSEQIAQELKYNDFKIEQLNISALLHDVGKIGIDDHILNKPGKLSDDEYNTIKGHPEIGYNILKEIDGFKNIIDIVKHHHERYDGYGYPDRKKSDNLSLDVFIIQLADSIDAMATDRPYRRAMGQEEILEEVQKNRGTQFHPDVVDAYLRILKSSK